MGYSVLIVDDSPVMRSFIRRVLGLSGFEVGETMEAGNGEEALAQLSAHRIDVILTDINMPGMNGEELLKRLEADGILKRIPALVISPFAKKGHVDHTIYDTASVLRLITRVFDLETLDGLRDRDSAMTARGQSPMGDLTNALQFPA